MPQVEQFVRQNGLPDLIFCGEMLDVATWRGLLKADSDCSARLASVPIATYFHENQWAYPSAPAAAIDHHYGFTNLITAAASDVNLFNSQHNLTSFLQGSRSFLRRMPDCRDAIDIDALEDRCVVLAPGFTPPQRSIDDKADSQELVIGWIGRFEHDKRPDRFLDLLQRLRQADIPFQLILLGQRGRNQAAVDQIRDRFAGRILHDGYASSRAEYESQLARIDVVVSTADHEFFGIAICESIWSGAVPVTPNGLSYVEYVPRELRYDSLQEAVEIVESLRSLETRQRQSTRCRKQIADWRVDRVVPRLDRLLETTVSG